MIDMTQPKDRYIEEEGLKLHYVEWGDASGETVVFVHGIRDQCRSWDLLIAALLAEGVPLEHAAALDLRGHGESDWPATRRGYQHEDFLYDLGALLRNLDKESVTLIGHSLGGSMALIYAGCFPDRVKSLILLESLGPFARADEDVPEIMTERLKGRDYVEIPFPYSSLDEAARALQKRFPLIPDRAAAHMALYGTRKTGERYRWRHDPVLRYRTTTMLSEGQIEAFIRRVACPILFVHGTESDFMKSVRGPRAKLFNNARIVPVEGAGHHIPHEKPEELAKIIGPFLRGEALD
jgi:pimeloyl-ACP methyl ester carboxylesterase